MADAVRESLSSILRVSYSHFAVGSLPFLDPVEAVDFIFARSWIVPFWPELPAISDRELMLARAERVLQNGWQGYEPGETGGLFAMKRKVAGRLPLLKSQCCGPLTLALFSEQLKGPFEQRFRSAAEASGRELDWQLEQLSPYAKGVICVLDEPGFVHWNALETRSKEAYLETVSALHTKLRSLGHYLGLHCCAELVSALPELSIDLLSFKLNASALQAILADDNRQRWSTALQNGMVLVPGAFSALSPPDMEEALQQGRARLTELGEGLAYQPANFLISAECGHACADRSWLERLYQRVS
ncbi:MAG: hypothetical protein K1X83_07725 [Oligoflexia bacterium]|nr:hypothetical protein [Oligoflexia bacterium]